MQTLEKQEHLKLKDMELTQVYLKMLFKEALTRLIKTTGIHKKMFLKKLLQGYQKVKNGL